MALAVAAVASAAISMSQMEVAVISAAHSTESQPFPRGGGAWSYDACNGAGTGASSMLAARPSWRPTVTVVDHAQSNQSQAGSTPSRSQENSNRLHVTSHVSAQTHFSRASTRKFLELDDLPARNMADTRALTATLASLAGAHSCIRIAQAIVHSRVFDSAIAFVIILNAIYIGVESDAADEEAGKLAWYLCEVFFTLFFLAELVFRIVAAKTLRICISNSWHVFDTCLVVLSCVDSFILTFISWNSQLDSVRLLRLVRLLRVARLFRLFRFFRTLWTLVAGIVEAMITLLWTWVLYGMLVYLFSIVAARAIGKGDATMDEYFGTVPKSMFTLFQITTTEDWVSISRSAMSTQPWTCAFFVLYLYVTTFAAMNVVVAVIVENTLDQAGAQRAKFEQKAKESKENAAATIYKAFCAADVDSNGTVTKEEFIEGIQNEETAKCLHQIGIDVRQAEHLFSLLDYDESGALDVDEFVGGMMKAVGPARARDVLAIECDGLRVEKKVKAKLQALRQQADMNMTSVEEGVKSLREQVQAISAAIDEVNAGSHYSEGCSRGESPRSVPERLQGCKTGDEPSPGFRVRGGSADLGGIPSGSGHCPDDSSSQGRPASRMSNLPPSLGLSSIRQGPLAASSLGGD